MRTKEAAQRVPATAGATQDEPALIRDLLAHVRIIAMVGASPNPLRPSFSIMRDLQRAGYWVIPVNPGAAGRVLHGEPVRASLAEAGPAIDLVDVFRRPDGVPQVVAEAIAAGVPAIWTQLGVRHEEALGRARAAGLAVVADRCISVELGRLSRDPGFLAERAEAVAA